MSVQEKRKTAKSLGQCELTRKDPLSTFLFLLTIQFSKSTKHTKKRSLDWPSKYSPERTGVVYIARQIDQYKDQLL